MFMCNKTVIKKLDFQRRPALNTNEQSRISSYVVIFVIIKTKSKQANICLNQTGPNAQVQIRCHLLTHVGFEIEVFTAYFPPFNTHYPAFQPSFFPSFFPPSYLLYSITFS